MGRSKQETWTTNVVGRTDTATFDPTVNAELPLGWGRFFIIESVVVGQFPNQQTIRVVNEYLVDPTTVTAYRAAHALAL